MLMLVLIRRLNKAFAGIAQSVVRRIGSAEVTSSILVASFFKRASVYNYAFGLFHKGRLYQRKQIHGGTDGC